MIVTIENVKRAREILRAWRENGIEYFRCFEGNDGRQQCEPCMSNSDPIVYKMPQESDIADIDTDSYINPIKKDLPFKPAIDPNQAINAMAVALSDGWESQ